MTVAMLLGIIESYGLIGLVGGLGTMGYLKLTKSQGKLGENVRRIEEESVKTRVMENEIKADIREIKEAQVRLTKRIDHVIDLIIGSK